VGADFDGDGAVDFVDQEIFATLLGTGEPGPSGLACAGVIPCPDVAIETPENEAIVTVPSIDISGTVSPAGTPVSINGLPATVSGSAFSLTGFPLGPSTTKIVATAELSAHDVRDTVFVLRLPAPPPDPPPDPAAAAPPLDLSVATDFAAAVAFLYEAVPPTQSIPDPGVFDPARVAVIRGTVTQRAGGPIPGTTISVLDHPEYGSTVSRADGMFDLAVNGGGQLVLQYDHPAYLPAQRRIAVPVNDYAWLLDVLLTYLDPQTTAVALGGGMQVAQGSVVSDVDGSRQATLLFPTGTTATMDVPGVGNSIPLSSPLMVRATEYSTADAGAAGMPGELPPTSGFTYAAEFTVDEALDAGATIVEFSAPIPVYLENFVGFPVGTDVPVAYYDRDLGSWEPIDDGRVIGIVSITDPGSGLQANVDIDGNGTPDNSAALSQLGITLEERIQLASLYGVGDSLWRVSVDHFSPYDMNWARVAPDDAQPPMVSNTPSAPQTPYPDCVLGSVIECQNQVLRETIELAGVPSSLHYSSGRVPGRRSERELTPSSAAQPSRRASTASRWRSRSRGSGSSRPSRPRRTS
jgi:hypothetical protein